MHGDDEFTDGRNDVFAHLIKQSTHAISLTLKFAQFSSASCPAFLIKIQVPIFYKLTSW